MSKTIKTWKDPYGAGFSTCRSKEITINEGLTVLVGCNGAGKSTLIKNITEQLQTEKVPHLYYNNLYEGGSNSIREALAGGNTVFAASAWCSSEGETIALNVSKVASRLRSFLETGKSPKDYEMEKWNRIFGDGTERIHESKDRWILLDAIDSGYSVDNVVELKDFFGLVLDDAKKMELNLYIIVAANEYELARGENCFDVNAGKYISFSDYDDYREFVLTSRKKKDRRMQRLQK